MDKIDNIKTLKFMYKLKIIYINKRSLKNKLDEIDILIKQLKNSHIIVLTETWHSEDDCQYIQLNNFTAIFNFRKNKKGGGTAVFLNNDIKFELIDNEDNMINCMHLKIKFNNLNINFITIYKAPNLSNISFIDFLESNLSMPAVAQNKIILIGDINILNQNAITNEYRN